MGEPRDEKTASGLAGRTVLVTGASSGIGRATSRRLLTAGARVIGVSRSAPEDGEACRGLRWVQADLGRLDTLPEALAEIARAHPEIDGLVANAGIGRFGSLEEQSPAQIRQAPRPADALPNVLDFLECTANILIHLRYGQGRTKHVVDGQARMQKASAGVSREFCAILGR